MIKICVILQGQVYQGIIDELINTYKNISNKIISTWITEDKNCIDICRQNGFDVIVQDPPEYITSVNYQVKSLSAGIKRAIELGFTHGFRCRTDIKINDIKKLLNILANTGESDKLKFFTMYQNYPGHPEYLTDQIAYGPLDKLLKYWSIYQQPNDSRFPELFLMETYFGRNKIKYSHIKDYIDLFIKTCYQENIKIIYTKDCYKKYDGKDIYTFQ